MKKIKILNVVGARPNFMKISPIYREMSKSEIIEPILLHTGQHYSHQMSKVFFDELGMPKPDIYLGIGSGSHAEQTAKIMVEFEKVVLEIKPDAILVVGDVNSTIACSLVAAKLRIKIIHVEAGLRSFDMEMPEEINRILTDRISDILFVTEQSGLDNLKNEGTDFSKVHFVGNVMIDSLVQNLEKIEKSKIVSEMGLEKGKFVLVTLHRPSNVDDKENLLEILKAFEKIQKDFKIIFPAHPRTLKNIENFGYTDFIAKMPNLVFTEPLGYLDFQNLVMNAKFILTDSGGIQEETTFLNVPCLTVRENTERPSTIEVGTNKLVGPKFDKIIEEVDKIINAKEISGKVPELWDGKTSERIVRILEESI